MFAPIYAVRMPPSAGSRCRAPRAGKASPAPYQAFGLAAGRAERRNLEGT